MRLSDGMVIETECGVFIELRTNRFVCGFITSWQFLAIGDNRLINEALIYKIEKAQEKLKLYQEAADEKNN